MRSSLGTGLLAAAAFMFMITWVLGICSTSLTDWWYVGSSSTSGRHEGLWSSCWGDGCYPTNQYDAGCKAMLNAVRAFSILTILFAFFTMCLLLAMIFLGESLWIPTLVCAILTVCFAVLPWSIYMGFVDQCVPFRPMGLIKGAGWCLAVSCLPMALVGLMFLGMWYCLGRSPAGAAAAGAAVGAFDAKAGATGTAATYYPGTAYAYPAAGAAPTYTAYPTASYGAYPAAPTYGAYPTATYGAGYPATYTGAAYPSYSAPAAATYTVPASSPGFYAATPSGTPMVHI